ncbi:hypothetical protein KQX54_011045 [Cotesia glomerata]|uniref:Uncharacterized protein n=1 Tax=Cotesia glomerata TaxID=32391 RepID=A0AAV7J693_COTGL|nr:hypothetical protein KQX54_011045 [Cotesia glomerata]
MQQIHILVVTAPSIRVSVAAQVTVRAWADDSAYIKQAGRLRRWTDEFAPRVLRVQPDTTFNLVSTKDNIVDQLTKDIGSSLLILKAYPSFSR